MYLSIQLQLVSCVQSHSLQAVVRPSAAGVRVLNVTCLQTRWSEVRAREVAEQPTKTPEPSGVNGDPDGPQLELGLNRAVLGEVSQRREAVNFWRDSVAMREIVSIQGGEPPLPRPTKPT